MTLFELLRQMSLGSETNPSVRVKELYKRRDEIDADIARTLRGNIDTLDDTAIKERFQQFSTIARELLADFREVEHNFRQLDRHVRERIALWDGAKGELLQEIMGQRGVSGRDGGPADMSWTTLEDLRLQVQKLWDRGRLLACIITPGEVFPLRLSLCKPDSAALSERFEAARAWSIELQRHASTVAPGYRLVLREFRHRIIGTNALPHEAWIDTLDQALRFIGKESEAAAFEAMVSATRERCPHLLPWLEKQTLKALPLSQSWSLLLDFVAWMQARPRPSIYIRQVDLPGMDSKFIESHRPVLTHLLDLSLPTEKIDGRFTGTLGFAQRYGFEANPLVSGCVVSTTRTMTPRLAPQLLLDSTQPHRAFS